MEGPFGQLVATSSPTKYSFARHYELFAALYLHRLCQTQLVKLRYLWSILIGAKIALLNPKNRLPFEASKAAFRAAS